MRNYLKVNVKKTHPDAVTPTYSHDTDSCCDLYSVETINVKKGERVLIETGIAMDIPEGFEVQIRPRSGNAYKYGLTVLNTPGTVDQNYKNSIKVLLINLGDEDYVVNKGDRIAQAHFAPYYTARFTEVDELNTSDRGLNGWGSTGN